VPRSARHDSATLRTLERHRGVAVEQAQAQHQQRATEQTRDEAAHTQLQRSLESTYSSLRALVQPGEILAGPSLSLSYEYARSQVAQLQQAALIRERSRALVDEAQAQLAARLEELKVIERLRERRRRGVARWVSRRNQWRIDELGTIKAWYREGLWRSVE
jgi:hypothetical protein